MDSPRNGEVQYQGHSAKKMILQPWVVTIPKFEVYEMGIPLVSPKKVMG